MIINTIKTRQFIPPKDDLFALLKKVLARGQTPHIAGSDPAILKERSVIVVTSKIVSIWQGRCIKKSEVKDKDALIHEEAELYIDRVKVPGGHVVLTMRDNILIPSAGIDESNAKGYYILWPQKPFAAAKKIYNFIKKEFGVKNFGVIISDSHTTPLRWGTMGIALSYWGFWPLRDYRGTKDIFGRKLHFTQTNIADALAAAAVLSMGEGKEQTPIAIIEDIYSIKFGKFDFEKKNPLEINRDEDIYGPLLNAMEWEKGQNKRLK